MKKFALLAAAIVPALFAIATPAQAQWAGQWTPATTTVQPTTTTTVPAPVPQPQPYPNGGWQAGQSQWGSFGGNSPVMDANSGRYISDGRVENPVNRVVYVEPGRESVYRSQAVGNYFNMGMSAIGLLAQVFAPRQPQPAPAAPAAPVNNGMAQCTANGQPSGVFVDNSDGQGLARCNAIFNR